MTSEQLTVSSCIYYVISLVKIKSAKVAKGVKMLVYYALLYDIMEA
jgi:hypothetical protein